MTRIVEVVVRFNLIPAILLACCISTFSFHPENIPWNLYVSGSFGVLLVYNFHRLVKLNTGRYLNQPSVHAEINQYRSAYLIIVLVSAVVCVATGYSLVLEHGSTLLIAAGIGLCYALPVIPSSNGYRSLREIPLLKGLAVAGVWCYITSIFPEYLTADNFLWTVPSLAGFWLARFLVFYIITGLSDIRDINVDPPTVKTIPQRLGVSKAIWFYLVLLSIVVVLNGWCYTEGLIGPHRLIGYLISNILLGILILKTKHHQPQWFYAILVDGVLIVQWVVVEVLAF